MPRPKTHTFRGKKFRINWWRRIGGLCDKSWKELDIVDGSELEHLDTVLHEGLHALGIPDKYVHKANGTYDLARLLWRLGWRRKS